MIILLEMNIFGKLVIMIMLYLIYFFVYFSEFKYYIIYYGEKNNINKIYDGYVVDFGLYSIMGFFDELFVIEVFIDEEVDNGW